jgi:sugar O-acyltransferase (sialic acid O-acetyltransferase NeuD family)
VRPQVIGIGAGGHAKVLIEILRIGGRYDVIGLVDSNLELKGMSILGVKVLGDDSMLAKLRAQGIRHFFIGVGSVGNSSHRKRLYEMCMALGLEPISLIHPSAIISPSVVMGQGNMIMAGAVISSCVTLGCDVIVNTSSSVDHDCCLGDHVHVAPGARLSATVSVGAGAHIGAGSVIRQSISIGNDAVIGIGSAVVKDVAAKEVVAGNPARPLPRRTATSRSVVRDSTLASVK